MSKRSKLNEVDIFSRADKKEANMPKGSDNITKSFRLTKEQAGKLKEYTMDIAPSHLMITEADIIRYMIENFDLEQAKKDFFKVKDN
jgi:hypothetical protein